MKTCLLLSVLIVTVLFKDGSSKDFDECWINTFGGSNSLHATCGSEKSWTTAYLKVEKFSLFDIEKIIER